MPETVSVVPVTLFANASLPSVTSASSTTLPPPPSVGDAPKSATADAPFGMSPVQLPATDQLPPDAPCHTVARPEATVRVCPLTVYAPSGCGTPSTTYRFTVTSPPIVRLLAFGTVIESGAVAISPRRFTAPSFTTISVGPARREPAGIVTMPWFTTILPVKVFVFASVSVPAPSLIRPPLPETTWLNVAL